MLKIKIVLAAILLSAGAFAQPAVITGMVIDAKANQVLNGATVTLSSGSSTISDETGKFRFDGLSPGAYSVVVTFIGYQTKTENISLSEHTEVTIALEETYQLTDEVVVRATRANDKTPSTFTTVNRQAIQSQNFGQDMPFLLNWTPSLVTTSDAGSGIGYTGVRIRGSDATRINVTINGIPYNDSESLGTFWVDVPDIASSSQSVQIQRGVGTSTNGAGAFGASINLQTNARNSEPYAEIINSAGSFNTHRHTISAGTGLLNNHWILEGRVSRILSDGYIDRASSDLKSYYFSGGFYAGKTIIRAVVFGGGERTFQSWYGVPESRLKNDEEAMLVTAGNEGWNETQTDLLLKSGRTFNIYTYKNQVDDYKQDHYQLHFSRSLTNSLTANASLHYTYGRGFYEEYRYKDDFSNYGLGNVIIGDSVIESSDIIRRRWLRNDFYGVTYALNYDGNKVNAVLGGAFNRYTGDHFGRILWAEVNTVPADYQYYFNTADKRDFNIFLKTNYQLSARLNAFVDLQYRFIGYQTSGIENKQNEFLIDETFNFFNPKVGLTYQLLGAQLYASFNVANREPVRDDFVDNPAASPKYETLYNVEAGYRKISDRYTLSANYYLMLYNNQLVLTGALNDVGATLRTNVEKSYRTGIEVEGALKISKSFTWSANATFSENKIEDFKEVLYDYGQDFDQYNVVVREHKNTTIAFSPAWIAASTFSWRLIPNTEIALLTKYVGKQYLDNTKTNARSIDDYLVSDIRMRYSFKPKYLKEFSFSLLVNNIFGEVYESNGYTYGYLGGGDEYRENFYYPQAGTNFMGMLTVKF